MEEEGAVKCERPRVAHSWVSHEPQVCKDTVASVSGEAGGARDWPQTSSTRRHIFRVQRLDELR